MKIPDILLPIINVKTNPLDALLTGIGLRFMQLAKTSDAFQEKLADRKFVIQLASEDGVARHYKVNHGSFSQHYGYATNPDLTMTFKDSATGVKILTKGDPTAFMVAVQAKELSMEGDYSLLMWFGEAAKHVVPRIPEQAKDAIQMVKPYAEKVKPYAEMAVPYAQQALGKLKSLRK